MPRTPAAISALLLAVPIVATAALPTAAGELTHNGYTFVDVSGDAPGRLLLPRTFGEVPGKTHPLILFLHGLGEGGTNNRDQVTHNIDGLIDAAWQRDAFLYAPQSYNGWWPNTNNRLDGALADLEHLIDTYPVDANRVYVTGLSAGGQGTWNAIGAAPDRFAAAVAIAPPRPHSWVDPADLADTPVWVFHAFNDPTVGKGQSRLAVNQILQARGQAPLDYPASLTDATFDSRFDQTYLADDLLFFDSGSVRHTELPEGGHAIWHSVYADEAMYDWMFSQSIPEPSTASMCLCATLGFCLRRKCRLIQGGRDVSSS
jgi:predicted peptidase